MWLSWLPDSLDVVKKFSLPRCIDHVIDLQCSHSVDCLLMEIVGVVVGGSGIRKEGKDKRQTLQVRGQEDVRTRVRRNGMFHRVPIIRTLKQ